MPSTISYLIRSETRTCEDADMHKEVEVVYTITHDILKPIALDCAALQDLPKLVMWNSSVTAGQ